MMMMMIYTLKIAMEREALSYGFYNFPYCNNDNTNNNNSNNNTKKKKSSMALYNTLELT